MAVPRRPPRHPAPAPRVPCSNVPSTRSPSRLPPCLSQLPASQGHEHSPRHSMALARPPQNIAALARARRRLRAARSRAVCLRGISRGTSERRDHGGASAPRDKIRHGAACCAHPERVVSWPQSRSWPWEPAGRRQPKARALASDNTGSRARPWREPGTGQNSPDVPAPTVPPPDPASGLAAESILAVSSAWLGLAVNSYAPSLPDLRRPAVHHGD
jgi:hypothetical protein